MPKATEKTNKEYAVFEAGGKQYVASVGDVVTLEGQNSEEAGKAISFEKVLLVGNNSDTTIGTPYITGAAVAGKILEAGKTRKLSVLRFRSKSRHHRKVGHRGHITKVEITKIK